jgi:hypothetical protein
MRSLQQHLADTAAHLNAQLCELNELRERAGKAQLSKSPQPKPWNGPAAISRSSPEMDREPALRSKASPLHRDEHWSGGLTDGYPLGELDDQNKSAQDQPGVSTSQ